MITIRPAAERGSTRISWLDSRHSFSFNRYFDPEHMGFRTLRVINEDFIAPGGVFGLHPHRDMEILTYVVEGGVEHTDSTGANGVTRPGEVQHMTAGTGIYHSEANESQKNPLHMLQIWIEPEESDLTPGYTQLNFEEQARNNRLRLLASPSEKDKALLIHQDARVYDAKLDAGASVTHAIAPGRGVWVQLMRGALKANGVPLNAGDGAAIEAESAISLMADQPSEFLLFDLA
jgi:redox-sensitive bicupin YhaK (pirin superfamily)